MRKAVLFDVDGVLVDSKVANRRMHQRLIELVGKKKVSNKEIDPFFSYILEEILKRFCPQLSEKELKRALSLGIQLYPQFYSFTKTERDLVKTIKT